MWLCGRPRAVELVGDEDEEQVVLHNFDSQADVYNVRRGSWRTVDEPGRVVMHRESILPGQVLFGARARIVPEARPGFACVSAGLRPRASSVRCLHHNGRR